MSRRYLYQHERGTVNKARQEGVLLLTRGFSGRTPQTV
jgi:hypothetical protein